MLQTTPNAQRLPAGVGCGEQLWVGGWKFGLGDPLDSSISPQSVWFLSCPSPATFVSPGAGWRLGQKAELSPHVLRSGQGWSVLNTSQSQPLGQARPAGLTSPGLVAAELGSEGGLQCETLAVQRQHEAGANPKGTGQGISGETEVPCCKAQAGPERQREFSSNLCSLLAERHVHF